MSRIFFARNIVLLVVVMGWRGKKIKEDDTTVTRCMMYPRSEINNLVAAQNGDFPPSDIYLKYANLLPTDQDMPVIEKLKDYSNIGMTTSHLSKSCARPKDAEVNFQGHLVR